MSPQLTFAEAELLADHSDLEPLIVDGVRCHGGFAADGTYVSPRTAVRSDAITAWETERRSTFGTDLLDVPLEAWPEHYPNVAQTEFLLEHGVRDSTIAVLTRIGTVEGFGAMLRLSPIPDLTRLIDDDLTTTATGHLGGGLFEAHARDEAGHEDQGGHKQMWFAARDIAFENPPTSDETQLMLERMGITTGGSMPDPAAMRAAAVQMRLLPDDIDFDLESLVGRMVRLLLIEISAFHAFAWAEAVLARTDLVAGDGEASRLVGYIRADETPHVRYLRTVLSELRDRTWIGGSGRRYPGTEMVGVLWDSAVDTSLAVARSESRTMQLSEVTRALEGRGDGDDLLEHFHRLGSVRPGPDGTWDDVDATDSSTPEMSA